MLIRILLIVLFGIPLYILFASLTVTAIASDTVDLSCVLPLQDIQVYENTWFSVDAQQNVSVHGDLQNAVANEQLIEWYGHNIWMDYGVYNAAGREGFDMPLDTEVTQIITGIQSNGLPAMIWIYESVSQPGYQWIMAFNDMVLHEGNGNIHPCKLFKMKRMESM